MCVRARSKKAGKWGDARAQQPITVMNEWTGFLPARNGNNAPNSVIQQIKQNRAIFVWMKKNNDFIKVRRKQLHNKHLIRRLTSQYGWVFLLVELYFYCRLVKIPSHISWQLSNKIHIFKTAKVTSDFMVTMVTAHIGELWNAHQKIPHKILGKVMKFWF